jgi:ribonucleoside-triphosphate reductase
MIHEYKVFTTTVCPKCPKVKDFMKTTGIRGTEINASTDEGLKLASELGISAVPTVILFDQSGKEMKRAHSLDEIKKIVEDNQTDDI